MYYRSERNIAIRQTFYAFVKQGYPIMQAYTETGKVFYLSEERIRQIVAKRVC